MHGIGFWLNQTERTSHGAGKTDADDAFGKLTAALDAVRNRAEDAAQSMARNAIRTGGDERLLLIAGVGGAFVVCLLIIVGISRAIGRPIMALTGAMAGIAEGDLEREIPASGQRDEIGAMARAVEMFRRHERDAREVAAGGEREQAAKQQRHAAMVQSTAHFGTSISGVMASVGQSSEAMRRAAAAMSETTTQVSHDASTRAGRAGRTSADLAAVAAAIDQLSATVSEIAGQVTSAATMTRDAVRIAGAGQDTMRAMTEAASRIGEVVRLISGIAGQTNLLALNATIEAARAGDAGRGFAVVANEVKILAAQTAKATSEIDSQIADVSSAARAALGAMGHVSEVIGKLDEVAGAIAAAVEQQTATTRELAANVQAVSGATDQTVHAMRQVAGVADNAGGVSRDIRESADMVGKVAEQLRGEVDAFLTAVRDDSAERPAMIKDAA